MNFFRPSGGILYHWRALRNRHEWKEFRGEVENWLADWPMAAKELILIGPSAGYTLSTGWLKRFDKVYAFDLDPLAGPLFRLRHPGVQVRFRKLDVFWDGERYSTDTLRKILATHPGAAVLLSNILGQLLIEHVVSDSDWTRFLTMVRLSLNGREWASYHDLFTHENGEVVDHMTSGEWKAGLDTRQFRWPLSEDSLHLIEGVRA
jgi:hypothetical protein